MSVINKMLRDLDARRAAGALPDLQRQGGPDVLLGTVSVEGRGGVAARRSRWLLGGLLLLVAAGAAAWYWLNEDPGPVALPARAAAPVAEPVATTATVVPAATAVAPVAPMPASDAGKDAAQVTTPLASAASTPAAQTHVRAATNKGAAQTPAVPAPSAAPAARSPQPPVTAAPKPTVTASKAVPATAAAPVTAAAVASAASAPAVDGNARSAAGAERRLTAAQETVAQAQAMWASGAREAAVDLVREAVVLAERGQPPDGAVLAMLVREQARMELALGRPAAVLDLLARLEPLLSEQADLWAVRGNAAQRLGRHAESVQAYQKALQLKPGEPRWLLGAAVSLAAQGQLEAAAEQAEQARARGAVSPEVLHYLRQAGVPLR